MSLKKLALTIIAISSIASIVLLLRYLQQPISISLPKAIHIEKGMEESPDYKKSASIHTKVIQNEMSQEEKLNSYFSSRFEGKLNNPYWQLKMIESMIQLFKQLYPDNWEEEMRAFIRSQYPVLADALLKKFNALNEYMQWMASLEHSIEFTGDEDRIRAMWDKRIALFGEEAYVIWEAAYKDQKFEKSMLSLKSSSAPLQQKITEYKAIFKEVHGVDVSSETQKHKTQIMTRFLDLENVQSDLKSMPAEERRGELRAFRKSMGLDEPALDRWETLDTERDLQRSASKNYVSERAKLESELTGDVLKQAIINLQNQLFGDKEADFIRNEEATGFYRFEREQQYGVN